MTPEVRPAGRSVEVSALTLFVIALFWGVTGGFLEGAMRTWLQAGGHTSFEERLTVISARLLWIAPVSYLPLFGLVGAAFAAGRRLLPALQWPRLATTVAAALAFLAPLSASGRIETYATVLLALGLGVTAGRIAGTSLRTGRRALTALAIAGTVVGITAAMVEVSTRRQESRAESSLPAASAGAPNVLLIIVDTLRADHLPTYGYSRDTAPAISRLAAQGVQFDRAVATSSWTLPSHVSLLTGRYPSEHGAEIDRYDNRYPTIGAALLEAGYRTASITGNTDVFSTAHGFGAGFLRFDQSFYSVPDSFFRTFYGSNLFKRVLRRVGWHDRPGRRQAENVTRSALTWISANRTRPFFLVLNYFDVHDPYVSAEPWRSRFSPTPSPGGRYNSFDGDDSFTKLAPEELKAEIDAYDGAVSYVDHWIGTLLGFLESQELAPNTLVVVTSDHGEGLGQHDYMGHGTALYFEQIHVPLILTLPGRMPAGVRVPTPVSHTDLAATILELTGGQRSLKLPGASLSHVWRAADDRAARPAISELRLRPWKRVEGGGPDPLRSIVDGDWHFIEHTRGGPELFNLNEDRSERNSVADARRAEASRLAETLRSSLPKPGGGR